MRTRPGVSIDTQIRRELWSPLELAPAAWFRADRGITLNGPNASAWADGSRNAHAAMANAVGADQPLWTAVDANFNGHPSLTFDGVSESMTAATSGFGATTSVVTVFRRISDKGVGHGFVSFHNGISNDGITAGCFTEYEDGNINVLTTGFTAAVRVHPGNGVTSLMAIRFDGANLRLRVNGVDGTAPACTANLSATNYLVLGARATAVPVVHQNVAIAEVIYAKRSFTDAELTKIAAYSRIRYGTP